MVAAGPSRRGRLTMSARRRACRRRDGTAAPGRPPLIRTHDAYYLSFLLLILTEVGNAVNARGRTMAGFCRL